MNKKLLIAAMLSALVPAVFAQTEADFNVALTSDGTGVVIKGYTGKTAAVIIPATIEGMPVREIGNGAFYQNTTITSVVIPQGVTKIAGGDDYGGTFNGANKLASVTIPEGLTEIGQNAFSGCTALTAITLPQSLTTLGVNAFIGSGIRSVTLPGGLTNFRVEWNYGYAYNGAFNGCKNLTTVTVAEGITTIPGAMFYGCTALTTVTLPASITNIGQGAFGGCTALATIALPASITKIEGEAFYGCSALTTVTIPASVEKIEFGGSVYGGFAWTAFRDCSRLNLASQAALRRVGYTEEVPLK